MDSKNSSTLKDAEKVFGKGLSAFTIKSITQADAFKQAFDELQNRKPENVISYGYNWLDEKLVGLMPTELVVVGGETGTGKTTYVMNLVKKASRKHKVAVFLLEDRVSDYLIKLMYFKIGRIRSLEGRKNYPWRDYVTGKLKDQSEFIEYQAMAYDELKNDNVLYQVQEGQMTIDILEERLKHLKKEGCALVTIDHLHYFDLLRRESSKADYIEEIMTRIRTLQKTLVLPIIMIVHYRKLESAKPTMNSFKDSISIPQNATCVINLWRDRDENIPENDKYITHFSVPKVRYGLGECTISARFNPDINDYEAIEDWKNGSFTDSKY